MFAEHAFDVKHLGPLGGIGPDVTPLREDRGMEAPHRPALTLVPAGAPVTAASASGPSQRLPEPVYRRRRAVAALVAVAVLTLVVAAARPDRVPPGEANPWPSTVEVSIPAELPGVYVVQPGDTLWDIAVAIAPGEDPRGLVHELAEVAGGSTLEPGQQIVIDTGGSLVIGGRSARFPDQPADAAAAPPSAT